VNGIQRPIHGFTAARHFANFPIAVGLALPDGEKPATIDRQFAVQQKVCAAILGLLIAGSMSHTLAQSQSNTLSDEDEADILDSLIQVAH